MTAQSGRAAEQGRVEIEVGGVRWWLREGADRDAVRPVLDAALDALRTGHATPLKEGRRKAMHRFALAAQGGAEYLLKSSRPAARPWPQWRASKARRELERAEQALRRGVPTPVPLAAGEERRGGRLRAHHLLIPVLPDVVDLRRLWFGEKLAGRERRALAAGFGAFARRVHDAGLFQDDFGPNNFLIRRGDPPEFLMIDFERVRVRRRPREGERLWMLAKVDRDLAGASAGDRLRFLLAYAGGDPEEARRWWGRIEAEVPRLARRDARRWARTATRSGRRFQRVRLGGGWHGFARRDAPLSALEEILLARPRGTGAQAMDGLWHVAIEDGASAVRRAWAAAHVLFARGGMMPRPLAALARGSEAVLLLEREPAACRVADLPQGPAEAAALRVLFERLLALGTLARAPRANELALLQGERGMPRALLLSPAPLRFPGRGDPARRQRARSLAEGLADVP